MKDTLYNYCITATVAIKELGISRNAFYLLEEGDPKIEEFKQLHANDWEFTPEKLSKAISIAGTNQKQLAFDLDLHFVRLNYYLHGKQRPSRETGHYQKLKEFCEANES